MHVKNKCVVAAVILSRWRWWVSQKCQHTSPTQYRITTQEHKHINFFYECLMAVWWGCKHFTV